MKALAVYPDQHSIQLIDHPEPNINTPTEVKIKMLEVGACGTDKEICHFEYGSSPHHQDYLIIGHESLGEVWELGSAVSRLKKGDLVVIVVRRPCSHAQCLPCRSGRQDFCMTGDFKERGINGLHGFMTEYVVEDEKYLVLVPKALREIAVLTEPLTIAEKALEEVDLIQKRLPRQGKEKALVLGAGPVGLLGAMALLHRGFETFAYSSESDTDEKANLVRRLGATYLSAKNNTIEDVIRKIGDIALVYEATGAPQLSFEMLKGLGINGIFVLTGIPGPKKQVELDLTELMRNLVLKNQVILGSVNAGYQNYQGAVLDLQAFQARWPNEIKSLISNRIPISSQDIQKVLLGQLAGIKNVIQISKP